MRHGHSAGWAPTEIGLFIDSFCRKGKPLPILGKVEMNGDTVRMPYTSVFPLKSAMLHYSVDTGLRSNRIWKSLSATIKTDAVMATMPPTDANTWFISVIDEREGAADGRAGAERLAEPGEHAASRRRQRQSGERAGDDEGEDNCPPSSACLRRGVPFMAHAAIIVARGSWGYRRGRR